MTTTNSQNNPKELEAIKQLSDLFWQFHNDRLADPSIKEMKPYIQPILDRIATERQEAIEQTQQEAMMYMTVIQAADYRTRIEASYQNHPYVNKDRAALSNPEQEIKS